MSPTLTVRVTVVVTDSGFIRPRRRLGRPRSAVVAVWGADARPVKRRWWRYTILAEFTIGSFVRRNVVGLRWTRRGADRAVMRLRGRR